jgi:hypothetical protein
LGVSTVCWTFDGGFTVLWVSCGFSWVLFCGLAGLFLCILPVYLGSPYAFLITILIKKKKCTFWISFGHKKDAQCLLRITINGVRAFALCRKCALSFKHGVKTICSID